MTRRPRVVLAAAAGVLAALSVAGPAAAAEPAAGAAVSGRGPVVLVGTAGLRWEDLSDATPELQSLLSSAAVGVLADRTVRDSTCPVDGWLSVSSGRHAADTPVTGPAAVYGGCRVPAAQVTSAGGPGNVPRWSQYRTEASDSSFQARLGLLGDTLAADHLTYAAVGPGAVIALAGSDGRVAHAWPGLPARPDGAIDLSVGAGTLAEQVRAALGLDPAVLAVDLGALRDPLPGSGTPSRTDQVLALDSRLQLVLGALPANATVVVASLGDSGSSPHLQLLAATGPAAGSAGRYATSLLRSDSTRQAGLAELPDLLPTVLSATGLPASGDALGAALRPGPAGTDPAGRLQRLFDLGHAPRAVQFVIPVFFAVLVGLQLLLYGLAGQALRRPAGPLTNRHRGLRALRRTATAFAAVPAAVFLANLLPWWRAGRPGLAVSLAVVALAAAIAVVALTGPWRAAPLGPLGVVGAVTAGVLGTDVLTGSHLVLFGLMGLQPLLAARFYGFGNQAFGVFATGALLAAIAAADVLLRHGRRRAAGFVVAGIGALAVILDGTPGLGSDLGGPPALLPAFGFLALRLAGVRITRRRIGLLAAGTVTAVAALAVADWLRPAGERTHLGRFVQSMVSGQAGPTVQRKALAELALVVQPLSLLVPLAAVLVVSALARPERFGLRPLRLAYQRCPALVPGLQALGVLLLIGVLINDSGAVIPAVAGLVALPLLVAACVRALELDDQDRLAAALAAVRRPRVDRRGRAGRKPTAPLPPAPRG